MHTSSFIIPHTHTHTRAHTHTHKTPKRPYIHIHTHKYDSNTTHIRKTINKSLLFVTNTHIHANAHC
jgi:hypothetical protein